MKVEEIKNNTNPTNWLNKAAFRLLQREWAALGIDGYEGEPSRFPVDPESLLLFTCAVGRYNAAFFDAVLNWLAANGKIINVQRLRKIMRSEPYLGYHGISAIAELMSTRHRLLKWKTLIKDVVPPDMKLILFYNENIKSPDDIADPDPLFLNHGLVRPKFSFSGQPYPLPYPDGQRFIIKLRSLFGITARSEIILYLLTHASGHPSHIARQTFYSQKTVQDTLVDMTQSGLVRVRPAGREKHYWIDRRHWQTFLGEGDGELWWLCWPRVFSVIKQVAGLLAGKSFRDGDTKTRRTEIIRKTDKIRPLVDASGLDFGLASAGQYEAAEDPAVLFTDDLQKFISLL